MQFTTAMEARDAETVDRLLSDDEHALAIGTDPEEWLQGGASIKAAMRDALAGGELHTRVDEVLVDAQGDVGWAAGRGVLLFTNGMEIPFRSTGVWRREAGEWKLLQGHGSIGVPNEQVSER